MAVNLACAVRAMPVNLQARPRTTLFFLRILKGCLIDGQTSPAVWRSSIQMALNMSLSGAVTDRLRSRPPALAVSAMIRCSFRTDTQDRSPNCRPKRKMPYPIADGPFLKWKNAFGDLLLDNHAGSGADKFVEFFCVPVCEPKTAVRFRAPDTFGKGCSVDPVSRN